jgi:hypothetical protein
MGRAWGAFHSLQRRNGASYSDEQHADLHDLTAAFYRAAGSLTGNLVNPKVGPTWGDLQALPDWLQNHRPTESNVSSGESIESAMVAVEYMDEAAPVPLQTNFFTSATRWSESSARITSNSITKAAAL